MSNAEEQTAVGDRAATDGHFITYQKIEEKEEEQQLQMLTRRELISWAISPDMPSYDSLLFRAVNGVDGAYRSPTANQKEKRKKREKRAMTNATRISSWCVVVGRGSLSLGRQYKQIDHM